MNKQELINKFKDLWEDVIEEDQQFELFDLSEIQEFNLKWHETWVDFLNENNIDTEDELYELNIVKEIFD